MIRLFRGNVVEFKAPIGNNETKPRPVIVLQNTNKSSTVVSVYCTTQNDGNDKENIFVKADSPEGKEMGLKKDTYIRPNNILHLPVEFFIRLIGQCPLMEKIHKIQQDKAMGR